MPKPAGRRLPGSEKGVASHSPLPLPLPHLPHPYLCLLSPSPAGTYAKELEEDVRIREALSNVQLALLETEEHCAAFRQRFAKYSHLWQDDMQAALRAFLAGAGSGSGSGRDGGSSGSGQPGGPSLEAFAAEIGRYKAIQDEVQALPASAAIGWIKVDARPLKQALLTWTSKWVYLFMRHLHGEVRLAGEGGSAGSCGAWQLLHWGGVLWEATRLRLTTTAPCGVSAPSASAGGGLGAGAICLHGHRQGHA